MLKGSFYANPILDDFESSNINPNTGKRAKWDNRWP
jgi:hypothetical protein